MVSADTFYRNRLGGILLAAGLVSEKEIEDALDTQRQTGQRLGDTLVQAGLVHEEDIVEARSLQLDIPHVHLVPEQVDPEVARLVPEPIARQYQLVPISARDDCLVIAMFDPLDVEAVDLVQRVTRRNVKPVVASEQAITALIDATWGGGQSAELAEVLEEAMDSMSDLEVAESADEEEGDLAEARRMSEQAPIVRTVNHILRDAVNLGASDIHVEPRSNGCLVRFRVDGALRDVKLLPKPIQAAIISRLKIMGDLDIAEKRLPQDGRITIRVARRTVDIRLSTLPTHHGERVVMRLLDKSVNALKLEQLGFSDHGLDAIRQIIRKPYGIVLVTGPTGSGKTTTLYSCLSEVRSPEINIITVEDPIEYELEGVSQSAVNVKAGLTFAKQLRAILRQDPDVILVGEIRDQETADIAFRASMTGHLVFSTLHCNDAAGAFARLTDMGVEPFLIASSLSAVLAQRLVRTICPACREQYEPGPEEAALLAANGIDAAGLRLARGRGCKTCANTGFKGRTLVSEVLPVSSEIRRMAVRCESADVIRAQAIAEGMSSMRQDAFRKVVEGLTTLDEICRKVLVTEE
ncbi:MAG: type II secretion system protein E [Armatimonadota bacterium]|nr:MAG: type II secretion system protein E [Armatimonadota bacterium]